MLLIYRTTEIQSRKVRNGVRQHGNVFHLIHGNEHRRHAEYRVCSFRNTQTEKYPTEIEKGIFLRLVSFCKDTIVLLYDNYIVAAVKRIRAVANHCQVVFAITLYVYSFCAYSFA